MNDSIKKARFSIYITILIKGAVSNILGLD
jgi:hypothetical protein